MNKTSVNLNGILTIEPPTAPLTYWEPLTFVVISLLIVIAIAFLVYNYYFSIRGKLKQKLNKLQFNFERQQLSSHETAFQLANIVQQGFRVHRLSEMTELPKRLISHQHRWSAFILNLRIARYSSNNYPFEKMQLLFSDANLFLKKYP